jgi:hypothetical protein
MSQESENFVVDGIFEVKFGRNKERRIHGEGPYSILVTPDAFYILKRSQTPVTVADIIQKKLYLEEIRLSDIQDIRFASLDKILGKLGDASPKYPFRIIGSNGEYTVYATKDSFFKMRDFLRPATQKKADVSSSVE